MDVKERELRRFLNMVGVSLSILCGDARLCRNEDYSENNEYVAEHLQYIQNVMIPREGHVIDLCAFRSWYHSVLNLLWRNYVFQLAVAKYVSVCSPDLSTHP